MTVIDAHNAPTEVKYIILSYPSITQIMVDLHCKTPWDDKSGAYLGLHHTENYASGLDDTANQAVITQHRLMSKIIGTWIKNPLTTDSKNKLRAFKYAYTFNAQDDGSEMFFVIVKKCNLIHA